MYKNNQNIILYYYIMNTIPLKLNYQFGGKKSVVDILGIIVLIAVPVIGIIFIY